MRDPFEQTVQRHGETVLRVCRAVLGPGQDAEDAWSETFLVALRSWPDLEEDTDMEAWLVRVAHRKAIDVTRARARHALPIEELPERPARTGTPGGDDDGIKKPSTDLSRGRASRRSTPMSDRVDTDGIRSVDDGSGADAAAMLPVDGADLAGLRARLATTAAEHSLLEVAYRTFDTPVGALLVAATAQGLVRVAFEREDFDVVLQVLAAKVSPRMLEVPRRLDAVSAQLEEYFAGRRHAFDVPLDHTLSSGFRQVVQRHLPQIGYGHTRSYREIAELVGHPRAVRAVGSACATNPLPVVVPCHRVLRSDGGLGGYIGGLEAKEALLSLERAA